MINGTLIDLQEFVNEISIAYGNRDAYRYIDYDSVVCKSFNSLRQDVFSIASWFIKRDWKEKHIAIIGSSSYNWVVTFLGIVCSANIVIPIDKLLPADDILGLLDEGDADIVFLSEEFENLADKIKAKNGGAIEVITFGSVQFNEMLCSEHLSLPKLDPNSLAEILFTSGTTGICKGVMLSHKNIVSNINEIYRMDYARNIKGPAVVMSVLPIHHTFELTVDNLGVLYCGATVCINDKLENIVSNLKRFKPHVILVVPTIAEVFHKKVLEGVSNEKNKAKLAAAKKLNGVSRALKLDTRRRIYRGLLDKFGGNLTNVIVGGAALRSEVAEMFDEFGINMFQGYGLTECAPLISANYPSSNKFGSVGKPVSYMDIKIEDGEILVKGDGVMLGYYKNPEATAAAFNKDGWLCTGDLGYFDDDGYLYITGRSKNLIILGNGKNIYPEELEGYISVIDGVKDVIVYEDRGKLCAAIHPTAINDDELIKNIKRQIKDLNTSQPTYKRVLSTLFIARDFPKTTTMKIKRKEALSMIKEIMLDKNVEHIPPTSKEQKRIVAVFEKVLGCKNIGIKDDFFDLGGDSLGALEASVMLGIPSQDIYENPSAEQLERLILSAKNDTISSSPSVDVNRIISQNANLPRNSQTKDILLTGSTGFLGSHILRELILQNAHVICLVRNEEKLKETLKYYFPHEHDKLKYEAICGDIRLPRFGLTDEEYTILSKKVGMVIHTAANVNHTGQYSDFELTNVVGTQNIIDFCLFSNATLQHTSTASVHGSGTVEQTNPEAHFDEFCLDIGQRYTQNVYIHSKYKAEERVLLAREKGLLANIFRIGNLTWRMSDGKFQRNAQSNGFVGRYRGLVKVGAYSQEIADYPIDLTPVDKCAHAYVLLALGDKINNIYNLYNPNVFTIESLCKKCFLNVKRVSCDDFEASLKNSISDKDVAILSFYSSTASISKNIPVNNDFTIHELEKYGFKWPRVGIKYLRHMKKIQ